MTLNQPVVIALGEPLLARQYHSVATIRCPDCSHRFVAEFEHGEPHGLTDTAAAIARLLDHARTDPAPHPRLLGGTTTTRRSA